MKHWLQPVALVLVLAACSFPYRTEGKFKAEAETKQIVINADISSMYICFLRAGPNTGAFYISEKVGYARWK